MGAPEPAAVLCVDDQSQIQALDRLQPMLPLRPRTAARQTQTHDYKRRGTTSLSAPPRFRYRRSHLHVLPAPPVRRIQQVPRGHREGSSQRAGHPPGSRQPQHLQDGDDPQVVAQTSPLPSPLHADQRILAQSGRTLVRRNHQQADPMGELPKHAGTRAGHRRLPGRLQRGPGTLHLDEVCRHHPPINARLLYRHH